MGFFHKFDVKLLKTDLKLALSRAKLARNRNVNTLANVKRDVADLVRNKEDQKALVKAEQYIQHKKLDHAYNIFETLAELLLTRVNYIASETYCPPDLFPVIHSILFCHNRIEGIDELKTIRRQFELKYGKDWVLMATSNRRGQVKLELVNALSIVPPSPDELNTCMTEITSEYKLAWKPAVPQPSPENHNQYYQVNHVVCPQPTYGMNINNTGNKDDDDDNGNVFIPRPSSGSKNSGKEEYPNGENDHTNGNPYLNQYNNGENNASPNPPPKTQQQDSITTEQFIMNRISEL